MIKYQVRSKELIDVYNEIKSRRLIMSPYFQRNLVWRQIHKIDFIKTILLGYPFPQIFIAKGTIDLNNMSTTSCIVDGQQRMNAILEFIRGDFKVDNNYFIDLEPSDRELFLKYQIPIIDLDINNDDPEIIEIFQRLNRTFYSLSAIEKLSTEYAPSEFMLLAKLLTNEIKFNITEEEEEEYPLQFDPTIPASFIDWSKNINIKYYNKLIIEEAIFTPYELARQVHLMFTLNVLATLTSDFYNRNEFVTRYLEEYSENYSIKNEALDLIERAANKILKLKFKKKSYWLNKANIFSILCFFAKNIDAIENLDEKAIKDNLERFEQVLPPDYRLAAKEAVNNKRERLLRNYYLNQVIANGEIPESLSLF
jgi:uncharacterized protein with ParB-like and HNH nuclease domain